MKDFLTSDRSVFERGKGIHQLNRSALRCILLRLNRPPLRSQPPRALILARFELA